MKYGKKSSKDLIKKARSLRKSKTRAESILWNELRNRRLEGLKFRRQHPVYNFILDFYCPQAMLGIEVDGSIHNRHDQIKYDRERQIVLNRVGIQLIRFTNNDIYSRLEDVLNTIKIYCLFKI
jgi:cyclase